MSKKYLLKSGLSFLLIAFGTAFFPAHAQLFMEPLSILPAQQAVYNRYRPAAIERNFLQNTNVLDTLTLPFFEDFTRTDVTFRPQISGVLNDLYKIQMLDSATGFACGKSGTLLKTTNRGRSWFSLNPNTTDDLVSIQFFNENEGIALSRKGKLWRTNTSGVSWIAYTITQTTTETNALYFSSKDTGYVAGDFGTFYKTINGGVDWSLVETKTKRNLNCILAHKDTSLWVSGDSGTVLFSKNKVNSFEKSPNLKDSSFTFQAMSNNGEIRFAVGTKGRIFLNWDEQNNWFRLGGIDTSFNLKDIQFLDQKNGWIVGDSGLLLNTASQGWSWEKVIYPKRYFFNSIALRKLENGILVGNTGLILNTMIDKTRPYSRLWLSNSGVFINNSYCRNPPTINAATFDGTDIYGLPYSKPVPGSILAPSDQFGGTDSLTSQPIDLSNFSKADSIKLSYFFQAGSYAKQLNPDTVDHLRVEFKTIGGQWVKADSIAGRWPELINFKYREIPVKDDSFFHAGFQFRFVGVGNRTGNFDIWSIDNIYLDNNRIKNDTCSNDVSFYPMENKLLKKWNAMPLEHFKAIYAKYPDSLFSDTIYTFARNSNSSGLVNITGDFTLKDNNSGTPLQKIGSQNSDYFFGLGTPLLSCGLPDSLRNGNLFHRKVGVKNIGNFTNTLNQLNEQTDLKYYFSIRDKDVFNTDYSNDTCYKITSLRDQYAYDDGTAELSSGVGGSNAQAAVEFVFETDDTLTDICLHSPRTPKSLGSTISFFLMVWQGISDGGQNPTNLFKKLVILPPTDSVNKFITFTMRNFPIDKRILKGGEKYYFGWQQASAENEIRFGADINTLTDSILYFNSTGTWLKFRGTPYALTLRPVFGREIPNSIADDLVKNPILAYPNPAQDQLTLVEEVSSYQLLDLSGRQMLSGTKAIGHKAEIRIADVPVGLYLLMVETSKGRIHRQKLLINRE